MFKRLRRTALGAATLALVLTVTAGAATFTPGSTGLGDPFFPNAGNGGYDVSHYSLTLDYDKATNHLAGTAVITATATQTSRDSTSTCGASRSRASMSTAPPQRTRAPASMSW